MEYKDVELALKHEADAVAAGGDPWPAERVSARLKEIAELLARIRQQHSGGIDASMGKRSGRSLDEA